MTTTKSTSIQLLKVLTDCLQGFHEQPAAVRIDAVNEGELNSGAKLILDGAHYLRDGDSVNAFEEIEVAL